MIAELENLLRRALGERVELETSFADDLWAIEADPGQIEQVLVNLAVNARDAMPDGGRLLIEAENVELDDEYAYMHPDTEPGRYVRLKVSDTGVGMDAETVDRAFEPFFTTKERRHRPRAGDGLRDRHRRRRADRRLLGARHRHHDQDPPAGRARRAPPTPSPAPEAAPAGRGEVVLVVEDEPDVRRMAERILTKGGYSVIGTARGAEAVEICEPRRPADRPAADRRDHAGDARHRAGRAGRAIRPGLQGHLHVRLQPRGAGAAGAGRADGASAFIEKPFNARALLETVREPAGTTGIEEPAAMSRRRRQ